LLRLWKTGFGKVDETYEAAKWMQSCTERVTRCGSSVRRRQNYMETPKLRLASFRRQKAQPDPSSPTFPSACLLTCLPAYLLSRTGKTAKPRSIYQHAARELSSLSFQRKPRLPFQVRCIRREHTSKPFFEPFLKRTAHPKSFECRIGCNHSTLENFRRASDVLLSEM
jgi:hypothetical protein